MAEPETTACTPVALKKECFNRKAVIPFGVTVEHVQKGMQEYLDFLGFVNEEPHQ